MLLYPKLSDSSEYKLCEVSKMITNFERGKKIGTFLQNENKFEEDVVLGSNIASKLKNYIK
jgi:hypothetical protein